jgi:hypothetical protein
MDSLPSSRASFLLSPEVAAIMQKWIAKYSSKPNPSEPVPEPIPQPVPEPVPEPEPLEPATSDPMAPPH